MDRPQIEALHEKASEHYLNGRFHDAQRAWHELLRLSPEDERAVEGLRLCGLMNDSTRISQLPPEVASAPDPVAPIGPPAAADVQDLDFDLSVLDGVAPDREGSIDHGDGETPEPVGLDPLEPESTHPAFTTRDGRGSLGAVEPRASRSDSGSAETPPGDPVEDQLKKRVRDLLAEARHAAVQGDRDEALSILSRIAILDEDNEEARELESSLRAEMSHAQQEIDHWLTEGVQWIAEGRLEDAIDRFKRVLDRAPNHMEARAYLAEAETALHGGAASTFASHPESADGPEQPAAQAHHPGAEEGDGAPAALRLERHVAAPSPFATLGESSMETVPVPSAPGRRGTSRAFVIAGALVAGLAVAAAGWFMLGGEESASPAESPVEEAVPPAGATASAASAGAAVAHDASGSPGTAPGNIERAERIGAAMRRAATSRERGDYEDAILAYNEVLSLDPDHQEARRGLLEAGEMYRSRKAIDDQLRKARIAFEDGEYGPALRLFYRLPPGSLDSAAVDRYKINGWVNLGITALKAGDTETALDHLGEALVLNPEEPEVQRLHALAEGYDGIEKDRAYYVEVNRLVFRGLED